MREPQHHATIEKLFATFPHGIALLELKDARDVSTWRLASINEVAANLVSPTIESFLSSERLRLGTSMNLPDEYREILSQEKAKTLGMVAVPARDHQGDQFYTIYAFPAGKRSIGLLFEDADALMGARRARAQAERQLGQICEFIGAILWRADCETLQFTYVSPEAQKILGYWPERWTSETNFWKKHLFPDDRQRVA
jgi:PAS domain-containing protein